MIPEPLHPALVHFPIVFAVVLPFAAAAAILVIRRTGGRGAWWPVLVLAVGLAGSAWIAVQTGEREEDRVEEVVSERVIHDHEEAAELFLILTLVTLGLVAGGVVDGRLGRAARIAATVAALATLGAGARVGHSGGELVYSHGAASAYGGGDALPSGLDRDDDHGSEGRERGEGR